MMRVTPLVWMSFGLASITISALMAGDWLVDVVPMGYALSSGLLS
jgi:hypothetical protein